MTVEGTFEVVRLAPPALRALDQTRLPFEERWLALGDLESLAEAIAELRVRGAPLLGLCGAAGVAIAAEHDATEAALRGAAARIAGVRPTAVELATGARACLEAVLPESESARARAAWAFCARYLAARQTADRSIARYGLEVVPAGDVLTHCNTGTLATGGVGTALGIVRAMAAAGRLTTCYVTETRPLLQGARLTTWELHQSGIRAVLLPDTAAAALIHSGRVAAVVTGADRIARNGDTANKIGTFGLALAAAHAGVPFFIAAPVSTIDRGCPDGRAIPIEFRSDAEVGGFGGQRWAPAGIGAWNPAFDVTPAELITGIVTDRGVARAPYGESLARLLGIADEREGT